MTRTCVICGALYDTHRPHQKTCGDAECKAENNRRRCRMNYTPGGKSVKVNIDAPVYPTDPHDMDTEGALRLCAAIFESAWREKDARFFHTPLARMIADTTGADLRGAYNKMISERIM